MSPSSSPPPGVPTSGGNAKYAIIALLLLLGIGGLFALRSFSASKDLPPPPLPSASVAQTAEPPPNPKLDDIPPPPPPEEKPEPGPTGPRIVYVPAGGCDGKCSDKFSTP